MTKNLIIISQSYEENKGSFSGFVEQFSRYAFSRGYSVKILCGGGRKKETEKLGYAEVLRFPSRKYSLFSNVFNAFSLSSNIKKYFKNNEPEKTDIIIANGEAALGVKNKKFILRVGDQPVLVFLKNMEIAKDRISVFSRIARAIHLSLLYMLEKSYFGKSQAIICSSEETRQLFIKYYGGKDKPYFIPHASVDINKLKKGKKIMQLKKERNLLFISAGEEKIRKGVVYLEKALPEIFSKYSDVNLLHVGDKFKWDIPEKYKSRIVSVGRVPWDKMKDYYASSELLVSCSIHEMFPNTIIEALAVGLPVVSSDIQGVNEYIQHKKEGFIFKRGDIKGIGEGIDYCLSNKLAISNKIENLEKDKYLTALLSFIEEISISKKKNINLLEPRHKSF